jgi:uncharacterized protein
MRSRSGVVRVASMTGSFRRGKWPTSILRKGLRGARPHCRAAAYLNVALQSTFSFSGGGVRCGLVRQSVRRTGCGAKLNATELGTLGASPRIEVFAMRGSDSVYPGCSGILRRSEASYSIMVHLFRWGGNGLLTTRCDTEALPAPDRRRDLKVRDIGPFILLTFALSWGLIAVMIAWPETVEAILGEIGLSNPAYLIAVWAPAPVAFALILRRSGGAGLRRFLGRLSPRGVSPAWWALAILGLPLVKIAGAILNGVPVNELLVLSPFREVLLISLFMLILGPVEEFGWRGTLLPLLQRVIAPMWAGLVVGVIWAFWHIPAFYLGGAPHTAWSLLPFLIGVTAIGVVMAVVYNRTGGSILPAVVIHWQLNIAFWPEAQPWENYFFALFAVVLVVAHSDVMFSRSRGQTVVVPRSLRSSGDSAHRTVERP